MTSSQRDPILDFVPEFPRTESLHQAWCRWWRELWWFTKHILTPVEKTLPRPKRKIEPPEKALSAEELKAGLESARKLVESAEARATLLRTKATALLTIVSIVTPLLSWWLASGRDRLVSKPLWLTIPTYSLIGLASCCVALCLLAVFRSQRVLTFDTLTPHHLIDLETGRLKVHDTSLRSSFLRQCGEGSSDGQTFWPIIYAQLNVFLASASSSRSLGGL
jgi:hypothetical protein